MRGQRFTVVNHNKANNESPRAATWRRTCAMPTLVTAVQQGCFPAVQHLACHTLSLASEVSPTVPAGSTPPAPPPEYLIPGCCSQEPPVCGRSHQDQMQAVQQQIEAVKKDIPEVEALLTAAEQAEDVDKARQLSTQLEPLYRAWVAWLKKKKLLLQADGGGEHCSSSCHQAQKERQMKRLCCWA